MADKLVKLKDKSGDILLPATQLSQVDGAQAAIDAKSKVVPVTTDPSATATEIKGLKITQGSGTEVEYKLSGKEYTAGTGIEISAANAISVKAGASGPIGSAITISNDQTVDGYTFGTKELITKEYLDKVIHAVINGNY